MENKTMSGQVDGAAELARTRTRIRRDLLGARRRVVGARVRDPDTVDDLVRIGREVERRVLARAVRWHLEDRVLADGGRTVVFE